MSTSLKILKDWAESMAETDEDEDARPLWAQIAGEVGAYLAWPDGYDLPDLWSES